MNIYRFKLLNKIREKFEKTGKLTKEDFGDLGEILVEYGYSSWDTPSAERIEWLKNILSNWDVFWKEFAPKVVGKPREQNYQFNDEWDILSRRHTVDTVWELSDDKKYCEYVRKHGMRKVYTMADLEKIPFEKDMGDYVIDVTDGDFKKKCPLFFDIICTMKKMGFNHPDNHIILEIKAIADASGSEINCNQEFLDGKINVNIFPQSYSYKKTYTDYFYDEYASPDAVKKMNDDYAKHYIFSEKDEKQVDEYLQKKRGFHSLSYSAQKEMEKMAKRRGDLKIDFKKNIKFKPMTDAERVVLNKVMGTKIR